MYSIQMIFNKTSINRQRNDAIHTFSYDNIEKMLLQFFVAFAKINQHNQEDSMQKIQINAINVKNVLLNYIELKRPENIYDGRILYLKQKQKITFCRDNMSPTAIIAVNEFH